MLNEIRVKIFGLNLTRIINNLISKGVFLNKIVVKQNFIIFSINENQKEILNDVCRRENKDYIILSKKSIIEIFKRIPYKFGGLFSILIIICYMYSFYLFVGDVRIKNDSTIEYDIKKVENVLNKNNIKIGSGKLGLKTKEIEKIILTELDDLSGCSVYFSGLVLNVKVYPEVVNKEESNQNIITNYDAVITEAKAYSGNIKVKVGDVVKKGDLLIESVNGASGCVKGKVYFVSTRIYNKKQEKIRYTGRFETMRQISLFNKILYKQRKNINYSKYLTKKCGFYLSNNYILPLFCEEYYFFEYEIETEIVEYQDVKEKLKIELYNDVLKKIPQNSNVDRISYSEVFDGDYTRLDCFVEVNIDLF